MYTNIEQYCIEKGLNATVKEVIPLLADRGKREFVWLGRYRVVIDVVDIRTKCPFKDCVNFSLLKFGVCLDHLHQIILPLKPGMTKEELVGEIDRMAERNVWFDNY
jgi:hypothetical protein